MDRGEAAAELYNFFWLTEAEKISVLERAAADPNVFATAKSNGHLVGMGFVYPGLNEILFPGPDDRNLLARPLDLEWDVRHPSSEEDDSDFECEFDDDDDEDGRPFERSHRVGHGSVHGSIELDDAARAAVEAAVVEALAADADHAFEEAYPEECEAAIAASLGAASAPRPSRRSVAVNAAIRTARRLREAAACGEAERVNALLRAAGEADPDSLSRCVRAGLGKGAFGFVFTGAAAELDTPVALKITCQSCGELIRGATVRTLLLQDDYAGTDYEEGGEGAELKCHDVECGSGVYVTSCCTGKPEPDNGKFHNHCEECPGLGRCIYDYRNRHCARCGRHPFVGPCSCHKLHRTINRARAGDRAALAALFHHAELFHGPEGDSSDGEADGSIGSSASITTVQLDQGMDGES